MRAAADGTPPLGRDILFIGGDEDQLALALPARFETMRRYVGAAPQAAGERFGLQVFPRDAALSQGHYDPHLELLAHVEGGEIRSLITCDAEGAVVAPVCHDEFVFQRAHITLSFAQAAARGLASDGDPFAAAADVVFGKRRPVGSLAYLLTDYRLTLATASSQPA